MEYTIITERGAENPQTAERLINMRKYIDENNNEVKASNYQEAAEKLYGQDKGYSGCRTTIAKAHRGYADVRVYKAGDKIGSYYGVQAATPAEHTLKRM